MEIKELIWNVQQGLTSREIRIETVDLLHKIEEGTYVEVVLCKDCEYGETKSGELRCGLDGQNVDWYDYCNYGKRKEKANGR